MTGAMPNPEPSPGVVIPYCSLTLFLSLCAEATPILKFMGAFHKFLALRDPSQTCVELRLETSAVDVKKQSGEFGENVSE